MSAIIAAEAMHRLPRLRSYGPYPQNTRFGDFHVAADSNLGELVARGRLSLCRLDTRDASGPRRAASHRRLWLVTHADIRRRGDLLPGQGAPGVWRLEVYHRRRAGPRPLRAAHPDKIVTRAISRAWPMTIALPDLGTSFTVQTITAGNSRTERAVAGRSRHARRLRPKRHRTCRSRHAAGSARSVGFRGVPRASNRLCAALGSVAGRYAVRRGRDIELRAAWSTRLRLTRSSSSSGPAASRCVPRAPTSMPRCFRQRSCERTILVRDYGLPRKRRP